MDSIRLYKYEFLFVKNMDNIYRSWTSKSTL